MSARLLRLLLSIVLRIARGNSAGSGRTSRQGYLGRLLGTDRDGKPSRDCDGLRREES